MAAKVDVWSYFRDGWDEGPQVPKVVEVKDDRGRRVVGVRVTVDDLDLVVISEVDGGFDFRGRLRGCCLFWRNSAEPFWNYVPQALFSAHPETPRAWVDEHPEFKELFVHLETVD